VVIVTALVTAEYGDTLSDAHAEREYSRVCLRLFIPASPLAFGVKIGSATMWQFSAVAAPLAAVLPFAMWL
jgi:hypothetical protein